jgi:phosphoglucosamine mutase
MIETDSKLSDLAALVKRYPQACLNVKVGSKPPLEDLKSVTEAIREVEKNLVDTGRVLVRYSGTENICRVMVEGPKLKQVQQMAKFIASAVQSEIGAK